MNNNQDNTGIRRVAVVGGGTAGWLTAARIAAEHPNVVQVTLIESPNIPTVGVGEGTWPTMRSTLKSIGVSETDFIRQCDATFKQGAKFANWLKGEGEFYYHPLMIPQDFSQVDLASYWCDGAFDKADSFSDAVCFQEALCEAGKGPKRIATKEFDAIANYAYHLDSGKFATFLADHAVNKLGVKHIQADVLGVQNHNNGDIASLVVDGQPNLEADLFVDCTGFRSLLLGQHYNIPFKDCSDVLFIDQALAVQVPYADEADPIACHTISTGQSAGWTWDIGLGQRRGVGYVYAKDYCSESEAHQTLANYLGCKADDIEPRSIPIRSGHRELFWHKNCVAVGLSAGFLEPLEASAIVLVELSASMIAEQLPQSREVMDIVAERFNQTFLYRWQRIIDFLKLHYCLSQRPEPFWRDNCRSETIPDSLQSLLALWQFRPPANNDFDSTHEVFPAASYQYVLYGMGFKTHTQFNKHRLTLGQRAQQAFKTNARAKVEACKALPSHRELINKIAEFGLQAV